MYACHQLCQDPKYFNTSNMCEWLLGSTCPRP
jgi:hypothetical protein